MDDQPGKKPSGPDSSTQQNEELLSDEELATLVSIVRGRKAEQIDTPENLSEAKKRAKEKLASSLKKLGLT
jgi:hypothetical protein